MSIGDVKRFWVVFCGSWFLSISAMLLIPHEALTEVGPAANAGNGKVLFEKRCTGCHSLDKNKEGPRLAGVYGRKAGSVADFSYSNELKAAKITDAAKHYAGKKIKVTGTVTLFNNQPQIRVTKLSQIKVVE